MSKRIFEQLLFLPWSLWCLSTFLVTLIFFFPFLVLVVIINDSTIIKWAHFAPHYLSKILLKLWLVRIDIIGEENIDPHAQLIYISNHRSYLDGIVASAVIPNFTKFLGKAEILTWPVLGYLMDKFYVGVQRDDEDDRKKSMQLMNQKLKTGASFFICPEGTCNTTRDLLKYFHTGAYRLAIQNGLPIVPLTFVGTGEAFPRHGFMLKPGKVTVYWGAPIPTYGLNETEHVEFLKSQTVDIIQENLLHHYPDGRYAV